LGNLRNTPFPELVRDWRATREVPFRRVCEGIWAEVREPADWPFINWYSEVRRRAANWSAIPSAMLPSDSRG
jgi:hypothetical protein